MTQEVAAQSSTPAEVPAVIELARLKRRLTPMQRKVLRSMVEHDIGLWGALSRLGHSAATGHRWMRKRDFARAHELTVQQALDQIDVTARYVLGRTKDVVERCMQETPVLDKEGKETGEYEFREGGALRGLELLGRYRRLWGEDSVKPQAPEGPGLTVIVQSPAGRVGVQATGEVSGKVIVQLPMPE